MILVVELVDGWSCCFFRVVGYIDKIGSNYTSSLFSGGGGGGVVFVVLDDQNRTKKKNQ